ncbi:MAG TPA: GNAT family N-acetyltransferase, partial [Symbiobacteriaceae bacterium]|nr:GNAT family N-acetyltransferase [Symbiobacteriaceae bacterium]
MVTIRPIRPDDYEACATIATLTRPEPTTGAEMLEQDQQDSVDPGSFFRRLVAEDENGRVLGYGFVERPSWIRPGRWCVLACTHPEHRGQGVGLALYNAAVSVAREGGAAELETWVRGEDDDSYTWAHRRGFTLEKQRTESV